MVNPRAGGEHTTRRATGWTGDPLGVERLLARADPEEVLMRGNAVPALGRRGVCREIGFHVTPGGGLADRQEIETSAL